MGYSRFSGYRAVVIVLGIMQGIIIPHYATQILGKTTWQIPRFSKGH